MVGMDLLLLWPVVKDKGVKMEAEVSFETSVCFYKTVVSPSESLVFWTLAIAWYSENNFFKF
jgi:hypothetical protein